MSKTWVWIGRVALGLVGLIILVSGVGGLAFGDWTTGSIFAALGLMLVVAAVSPSAGHFLRWPLGLFGVVVFGFLTLAYIWTNWWGAIGTICLLQLVFLELIQSWDKRDTPIWRREYRFPPRRPLRSGGGR